MKGDLPTPALRLLATLPVRTHIAQDPDRRRIGKPIVPSAIGFEKGKPVRIGGAEYPSIAKAIKKLHIAKQTVHKMLQEGTAEYV